MQTRNSDTRRSAQRLRGVLFVSLGGALTPATALAQVNSGSDGSDGALNPTSNLVIDMHDHPDGIFQYTSVNIPSGVQVSFIPNDANTPVIWLVQGNCTIQGSGAVDVAGKVATGLAGGFGGPGGYRGGSGPPSNGMGGYFEPGPGLGPGGGKVAPGNPTFVGGNASYGTVGSIAAGQHPPGDTYGSAILIPFIGGSGGGGGKGNSSSPRGGSGGGGAILIVCGGTLALSSDGYVYANGGPCPAGFCGSSGYSGGGGSGGAVRIIASDFTGAGEIICSGGPTNLSSNYGGNGRIRIEAVSNNYTGMVTGVVTYASPGIVIPPAGQQPTLTITSVAGLPVSRSPGGGFPSDVTVPAAQTNPIAIVVSCHNIPLNSQVTVEVKPTSGAIVSAVGANNVGTVASSTATVSLNMPTGEGTIQAKAVGCPLGICMLPDKDRRRGKPSLLETGLAANGERFKTFDVIATLDGRSQVVYVTESGKRFALPAANSPEARREFTKKPG